MNKEQIINSTAEFMEYLSIRTKGVGMISRNEEGFITVVTVILMLLLLTIVGVSSINNSVTESFIVRNNNLYTKNFYLAESAGYEASQLLENADLTSTNPTASLAWIIPIATDMTDRDNWINDNGTATDFSDDAWTVNSIRPESFYTQNPGVNPSNLEILLPGSYITDEIRLAAHFQGVTKGSSLKVTSKQGRLYGYNVYGMYSNLNAGLGEVLIEMGYRKRF